MVRRYCPSRQILDPSGIPALCTGSSWPLLVGFGDEEASREWVSYRLIYYSPFYIGNWHHRLYLGNNDSILFPFCHISLRVWKIGLPSWMVVRATLYRNNRSSVGSRRKGSYRQSVRALVPFVQIISVRRLHTQRQPSAALTGKSEGSERDGKR